MVGKYTLKRSTSTKWIYVNEREPVEIEVKSGMDSQKIRVK